MKNLKLAVLMVVVLVLSGVAAFAAPSLSDSVAVVSKFKGAGYIYTSGSWKPVSTGMPLYEGDTIATKSESFVEVVFDSATLVRVDADSSLKLSELKRSPTSARTIFSLLKGRVVAIVDKLMNPESAFEVHTKMAIAAVKGTELAVEEGNMAVYEGSVLYSNAAGTRSVQVEWGNESEVASPGAAPASPSQLRRLLHVRAQVDGMREDVNVFRNLRNTNQNVKEYLIQREKKDAQGNVTGSSESNLAVGGVNTKHGEAVSKVQDFLAKRARRELHNTRSHAAEDLGYVNAQMQADLHLGKTMTDVHGNRVRLEEYIFRPEPREVDLLSITMRDERLDYLRVQNVFNTDLPEVIPASAWAKSWFVSPVGNILPQYYRTNEVIRMSNGDDEVEMLNKFGYEKEVTGGATASNPSGREYLAEPLKNLITNRWELLDYENSLKINGDIKEHKRNVLMQVSAFPTRKWIRLADDKTFTSTNQLLDTVNELVAPINIDKSTAEINDMKNLIIVQKITGEMGVVLPAINAGSLVNLHDTTFQQNLAASAKLYDPGTVTQIRLSSNLDLAAQATRKYNDGSNLTLKVYLIDDYGDIQRWPTSPTDWFDLVFNTNIEMQLNSNEFFDQDLGIDVVSKLLWWIAINPKNSSVYNDGSVQ